jgi:hypothetical protein
VLSALSQKAAAMFHAAAGCRCCGNTSCRTIACHAGEPGAAVAPRKNVKASKVSGVTHPAHTNMPRLAASTTLIA